MPNKFCLGILVLGVGVVSLFVVLRVVEQQRLYVQGNESRDVPMPRSTYVDDSFERLRTVDDAEYRFSRPQDIEHILREVTAFSGLKAENVLEECTSAANNAVERYYIELKRDMPFTYDFKDALSQKDQLVSIQTAACYFGNLKWALAQLSKSMTEKSWMASGGSLVYALASGSVLNAQQARDDLYERLEYKVRTHLFEDSFVIDVQ